MNFKPGDKVRLKEDYDNMVAKKGATGIMGPQGAYSWNSLYDSKLYTLLDVIWDKSELINGQSNGSYQIERFELVNNNKIDYMAITKEVVGGRYDLRYKSADTDYGYIYNLVRNDYYESKL